MTEPLPPFLPLSEGLMSNLASRAFEWKSWQISEIISGPKNKVEIILVVHWQREGRAHYRLRPTDRASLTLTRRMGLNQPIVLTGTELKALRSKDSRGRYRHKNLDLFNSQNSAPPKL